MADTDPLPGPRPPLTAAAACELARQAGARAAILVEGWSDQAALETLARRRGRDLQAERVIVLPMGGVGNIDHFVRALGPQGLQLVLAGLCDAAELAFVRRCLERLQPGRKLAIEPIEAIEAQGFFVCDPDLEHELIAALGCAAVEQTLASEGEIDSFRRFQGQPAQRGRDHRAQLHRFMGTRAGRKIRYGRLLVETLDLDCVPRALDRVLNHVDGRPANPARP